MVSTVLIVDDYPAVRKTLRSLLEKLSSVVCIEAVNGLDAIAKADTSHPDLIILDLGMPEMNGFEAATVLHEAFSCITEPQPLCRSLSACGGPKLSDQD